MRSETLLVFLLSLIPFMSPAPAFAQTGHHGGPASPAQEAEDFFGEDAPPGGESHAAHGEHLNPLAPEEMARLYRFTLESRPERPAAGETTVLTLTVADADGRPVTGLEVSHERLAHFLVAGTSLGEFHHLHAEDTGPPDEAELRRGRISVPVVFGTGGTFRLTADLAHGGRLLNPSFAVEVDGTRQRFTRWNFSTSRTVDGARVSLEPSTFPVVAGEPVRFTVTIGARGAPLPDLEDYLGAAMHAAIYGERASSLTHTHGSRAAPAGPGAATRIVFDHTFPAAGNHRLFLQFQRSGRPVTVHFDVAVEAPRDAP